MLKLKDPNSFRPKIQRVDGAIALNYEPWDMRILAYSYDELERYVIEHVTLVWRLLMDSDEAKLTKRGRLLRRQLLEDFEEVQA